jgi:hypothetical protein
VDAGDHQTELLKSPKILLFPSIVVVLRSFSPFLCGTHA